MSLPRPRRPLRDADGVRRFRLFLVAAVLTVAVTRLYLAATGFPQVGSGDLHVAHLLWGGLGMLVAHLLQMLFLGRAVRTAASVLAGVGFGLFIDEVGKFVTRDHDYFYEPVAALIHATLLGACLFVVLVVGRRPPTERERRANAAQALAYAVAAGGVRRPAFRWPDRLRTPVELMSGTTGTPAWDRVTVVAVGLLAVFSLGRPLVLLSREPGLWRGTHVAAAVAALLVTAVGLGLWAAGRRVRALGALMSALVLHLVVVQFFWLLDHEFAGFALVLVTLALLARCRGMAARHRTPAGDVAPRTRVAA
ncbi:hypothetical protein O7600_10480 [Micromonospora sp. WMMA1998]|uniref:hypothetical protein n=1 Tax=Micromonospora sp. WMMA1998 TaxID=3015167 RepID=UPI00248D1C60|nr:hypothetical protein [Micromonospora sp. WMMA1998]WBC17222.1 hypothetical protein O7600_10480 [Micromonospora sp. WMMA1998]